MAGDSLQDLLRLIKETHEALEQVKELQEQVQQKGITTAVKPEEIAHLKRLQESLNIRAEEPGSTQQLARNLDHVRSILERATIAARTFRQELNISPTRAPSVDIEGFDIDEAITPSNFGFDKPEVNAALDDFQKRLQIVSDAVEKFRASGQIGGEEIDRLSSRLAEGKKQLTEIAEKGYLAGDAFKSLQKLAGNLASTRGVNSLGNVLADLPTSGMGLFFKGKTSLGEDEKSVTYRGLFTELDRQRKALAGGAPIKMVDEETTEEVTSLSNVLTELSQKFPTTSRSAAEMQRVLKDVSTSAVVGTEHAEKFSVALQKVYESFIKMGRAPQTGATQESMRDMALSLAGGAQDLFSGMANTDFPMGEEPGKSAVSVQWRHVGDYKESLRQLASEGIDLEKITQDMVRQIAELAEQAGIAAGEVQVLGGTINAADRSFTLAYKVRETLGEGVTQEYKTSQYFKAAPGGETATPMFEHGTYDVRVTDRVEKERAAVNRTAAAIKDMYRKLEQEIKKAATEAQQDLGPDAIITDIKPEVNEVTGAIEIVVSAIRKLSDSLSEPAEKVYKLQAALDDLTGTAEMSPAIEKSRSDAILSLFPSGKAQDKASENINKLLQGTSLTLEKDAQAAYDYNAQLVRLSLSKRNLQGITEQLNITLDKNGNVVNDLRTRYSGFYQAIGQNIVRLTRWAFAANLVYAAMSKLQELPAMLGNMDAASARIATLTTLQKEQVTGIFDQLFELSRKNSFAFEDTFATAEKALQFTGGNAGQATDLIGDSMVYAKLAAVDLTTAVDTLAAALSQLGMSLDQGDQLMSKWVTLSQQYGVSINDLARTYGAAGSVAMEMLSDDTDLAIDEFNALITVTSRVTTLSSDQLSNFMRTILTNVTSPSSIAALRRYGIEVETLGGGYRDFVEILKDVYYYTTLYEASSPQALSDIARALGGGGSKQTSRGQAVIENIPMLIEAIETSGDATTDFDKLMQDLTDNLQDDIKRMNTAFSELLNTIGREGMLDIFSTFVQGITKVVDAFTDITKSTDNAIIKVALMIPQFQALNAVVGKLDGAKVSAFFSNFQGNTGWLLSTAGAQIGGKLKDNFAAAFTGGQQWNSAGLSIGMGLLSGINAAISGKSGTTSLVTGLSSAIGAAVGLALGGGNPAVAFLGSQLASLIAGAVTEGIELGIATADYRDAFGGKVSAEDLTDETIEQLFKENRPQNKKDVAELAMALQDASGVFPASYLSKELPDEAFQFSLGRNFEALEPRIRELQALYKRLLQYWNAQKQQRIEDIRGGTPEFNDISVRSAERKGDVLGTYRFDRQAAFENNLAIIRKRSLMDLVEGKRSLREYREILERLPVASDPAAVAFDVMANEIRAAGLDFDGMVDIMATGSSEVVDYFQELINKAAQYKSMMEADGSSTKEYADTVAEANEVLSLMLQLRRQSMMPNIPSFTNIKDYTQPEFMDEVYPLAKEYDKNKLTTYFYANEDDLRLAGYDSATAFVDGVIAGLEPIGAVFKDKFGMIEGISSEAMQYAMQKLNEMAQQDTGSFNIQRLQDVSPDKFGEIEKRNRYWLEYIAKLRGMTADQLIEQEGQEFNLVMGEENVWKQLLSVNEAMNFTLQDILETEKKQLEGIWNIPEGASFWVPITSLFYNKGDQTNYPTLPPLTSTPQQPTTTSPTIPGVNVPPAGYDKLKGSQGAFDAMLASIMEPIRNILGKFKEAAASISPPEAGLRSMPDTYLKQLERAGYPQLQMNDKQPMIPTPEKAMEKPAIPTTISFNLPEPSKITVESTANIQLIMNERVLANIVRTFLARETNRVIKNRTHTATLGKV